MLSACRRFFIKIKMENTFEVTIEEVFEAYYACRRSKRYSSGALQFECNLEENLVALYEELKSLTWQPRASTCFIVTKPVRREIFAAAFRDRIVHHLLIRRLNPYFERYFIDSSFACRENKGTHAAIARAEYYMKSAAANGKNAYVLKIDIQGVFMSINRTLLYERLMRFIDRVYLADKNGYDGAFEKSLCRTIIFNDPCSGCIFKSPLSAWNELPANKSLFHASADCGLPIGNLTSQVFANFYLSSFDHFVQHTLRIKKYVRYVDDCVIVADSSRYLRALVPVLRSFLKTDLRLTLHPKKIYLQPSVNGVLFLGCFIKLSHTVVCRRTMRTFESCLQQYASLAYFHKPVRAEREAFRASVNSYLGILRHYSTYRMRVSLLKT